jgi:hypothetical protein
MTYRALEYIMRFDFILCLVRLDFGIDYIVIKLNQNCMHVHLHFSWRHLRYDNTGIIGLVGWGWDAGGNTSISQFKMLISYV